MATALRKRPGAADPGAWARDAVVVGGGVAGSAAALRLAQRELDVVLVVADVNPRADCGERMSAAAAAELRTLGFWDRLEAIPARPCRASRSVWGSERLRTREHFLEPTGGGWWVSRRLLERMLLAAVAKAGARVLMLSGADARRVQVDPRVDCCTGPFVVDATGRPAVVARRVGARRVRVDRLVGVVWTFPSLTGTALTATDPSTLVEAAPWGWCYSAPSAEGLVVAAFTDGDLLDRDLLDERAGRGVAALLASLPHTKARAAGAWPPARPPRVYSAATSRLVLPAQPRLLAVGDAITAVDPLAGDGLRHALSSGRRAAEAVVSDLTHGTATTSRSYRRQEEDVFDDYITQRDAYYGAERRWRHESFWRRRHHDLANGGRHRERLDAVV